MPQNNMLKLDNKKNLIAFFVVLFILYTLFAFIRPYEDDESQYIRAGVAILNGELNPFKVDYYGHYSNPFHYIIGSPLAALIYGLAYKVGSIFLVRIVATISILLSILIVYKLIKKLNGNATIPLILIGFSSSTIMLASDGLLDSIALLFLMTSLYLIYAKKMFFAGLLSALAMTSKFILVMPFIIILIFQFFKKKWLKYLLGILIVIIPFLILYQELIPVLINFLLLAKLTGSSLHNLRIFLKIFFLSLPIASIITIIFIKSKKIKGYRIFLIPVISIILFQVILLDFTSFMRHLPYAEFSAAILLSVLLKNKKIKFLSLIMLLFITLSVGLALRDVNDYPSYNSVRDNLSVVNGRVLAINLNSFILIKNMPINATAENVYNYYYFNYDGVLDSKVEEYEQALKDGFFDYVTIASYSSDKVIRYELIEDLVRKYYCPLLNSKRRNGIDIYTRCK